jgi:tetratricopeptide (TPR) repeat protein
MTEAAKAFEECTRSADKRLAGEAYLGLGKTELQRYSSLAESYLMKARDLFESLGALRLLAETQYWTGGVYEDAGQAERAREAFEKGRAIAFDVGDRRWEGLCAYGIARTLDIRLHFPEAIEVYKDALELLEREGSRLDVAKVCTAIGGACTAINRYDEAEVYLNRGLKEARATGAVGILSGCLYNMGAMHIKPDSVREAIPFFKEAVELEEQQERYDMAAWCYAWMAVNEWKDGSAKLGDQYMARADKLLSRTREPNLRSEALRIFARAYMRVGRKDEARRCYESAIKEARAAGFTAFEEYVRGELKESLG